MDITFIRHGHAEHLLDYPNQLNWLHPGLTELGKSQVTALRKQVMLEPKDVILVSPTKRTIETALLLTARENLMICPLVGPRMFPQNPEFVPLVCDQIYSKDELHAQFAGIRLVDLGLNCWDEGINRMEEHRFEVYAEQLLQWCREQDGNTVIISHDGTITNYRILLGEKGLTRRDFLGEAGMYTIRNF
ncbi:histidine phosphatase family protein [Paenibacillus xylanilyticus]|uniref:Histidine phosphatase family protein n=1 Tax=Paenibacillus xylanilyticus TaxID=248903 RepID=A0A7Y6EYE1_9BACL|nr:histidine phosphatase family protein [Paenibacillus xylanilyticus]NUU79841.1 histidine phosphatase family protein [Paenibacillus xylanilyticus]